MKLHDSTFLKRNGNIELPSVFSRLNAGGVYLKLSLETRRLFGARRLFIVFIKWTFQPFIFILSTGSLLN